MSRNLYSGDETARCEEALMARHGRYLTDERLSLSARLEEGAVMLTLIIARLDGTSSHKMEAALEVPEDDSVSLSDACDLCLDFLDWFLDLYFGDNRETLLPMDWQAHQFGEHRIMARGDITNPTLDDAADAWLRGERPEIDPPPKKP